VNHEPGHPIVKMYPESFRYKDEIYQYKNYTPESVRVLISLDMAGSQPQMPYHVPVCWVREYGAGRLFYTNFGHNDATWKDPDFQAHVLSGMRWALKLQEAPASPNPDVQDLENAKSFLAVGAPLAGKDGEALLAKVQAKAKKDPQFLKSLRGEIDAFQRVPVANEKRDSPEKIELATANRKAAAGKIIHRIEN
jgi:hypothetical protein